MTPEQQLAEAADGRGSLEDAVAAVVASEVIVLLAARPDEGKNPSPVLLEDAEGRVVVPVFTSESRVPEEAGEAPRMLAPLEALLGGWPDGVGLVINPAHESIVVDAEGIVLLAGGDLPVDEADEGESVALGLPAVEPVELLRRFVAGAASHPGVRAVYRAQAVFAGRDDEAGLLVGILVEGGDPDAVAAAVVEHVGPTTERFDAFAFTPAEMESDPLVAQLVALGPYWTP